MSLWVSWFSNFVSDFFHSFEQWTFTCFGTTFHWSSIVYGIFVLLIVVTLIKYLIIILTW